MVSDDVPGGKLHLTSTAPLSVADARIRQTMIEILEHLALVTTKLRQERAHAARLQSRSPAGMREALVQISDVGLQATMFDKHVTVHWLCPF